MEFAAAKRREKLSSPDQIQKDLRRLHEKLRLLDFAELAS